jgi:glutathione peroxidase
MDKNGVQFDTESQICSRKQGDWKMGSIHEIMAVNANGEQQELSAFKGSALLIVNLASKCGFTPQYKGLQELYETYKDQGLEILGFPSNDFGGQEPGTIQEIQDFCSTTYGVNFPLFDKVSILGEDKHPLYKWLTENSETHEDVKWNFEKFLVNKEGQLVGRYSSQVTPEDKELRQDIEAALR